MHPSIIHPSLLPSSIIHHLSVHPSIIHPFTPSLPPFSLSFHCIFIYPFNLLQSLLRVVSPFLLHLPSLRGLLIVWLRPFVRVSSVDSFLPSFFFVSSAVTFSENPFLTTVVNLMHLALPDISSVFIIYLPIFLSSPLQD